jgi:short-subunit dehydrogenase
MLDFICDYKYELLSLAAIGVGAFYWSSAQNKKGPLASIKWQLLDNTTVVITGANTGIGYETALALAKRGARVVMACRDLEKAKRASERIMAETNNNANVFVEFLDLASLDSVKEFANRLNFKYPNIDLLINNAGRYRNDTKKTDLNKQKQYLLKFKSVTLIKLLFC